MNNNSSLPGFTADASLGIARDSHHGYQSVDAVPAGEVVLAAIFAPVASAISRCGAACKCCSKDGNGHCCEICDKCE